MNKAHFIKALPTWRADAALYRLDPPLMQEVVADTFEPVEFVAVSAVLGEFAFETFIFATDVDGDVVSWTELPGSIRGVTDHAAALAGAGYEIVRNLPELPAP